MSENYRNSGMMWAYLIHLSYNMWGDWDEKNPSKRYYQENITDDDTWNKVIDFLPSQGFNTVVIDVGDAIKYERHPEISIKGAWSKDRFKKELNHMRAIGLTPIPKLNFSATHDAWLGVYSRMLSSPTYYQVCKDVIEEVAEVFDYPKYFHLGMDEERAANQGAFSFVCVRSNELLWHDMFYLFDVCEKVGCRPWIWSDLCWSDKVRDDFLSRMPKSALQSNWHYLPISKGKDGRYSEKEIDTYRILEEAGFEQVPTCSTKHWYDLSAQDTMEAIKEMVAPERLKGYMTVPWNPTTEENQYSLLHDAMRFGLAKKNVYPEDC